VQLHAILGTGQSGGCTATATEGALRDRTLQKELGVMFAVHHFDFVFCRSVCSAAQAQGCPLPPRPQTAVSLSEE
jgi:hypothetical protein